MSLRSKKTSIKYKRYLKQDITDNMCTICDKKPIKIFNYWKIVENIFPYDLIAKKHHMLMPINHKTENKLTKKEILEFYSIKNNFINKKYDYILESTNKTKTVPEHFHIHLIVKKT